MNLLLVKNNANSIPNCNRLEDALILYFLSLEEDECTQFAIRIQFLQKSLVWFKI
jgi:hypothetical protein